MEKSWNGTPERTQSPKQDPNSKLQKIKGFLGKPSMSRVSAGPNTRWCSSTKLQLQPRLPTPVRPQRPTFQVTLMCCNHAPHRLSLDRAAALHHCNWQPLNSACRLTHRISHLIFWKPTSEFAVVEESKLDAFPSQAWHRCSLFSNQFRHLRCKILSVTLCTRLSAQGPGAETATGHLLRPSIA